MLIPAGVKVHLALGYTDLRKGIDGLGVLVERVLAVFQVRVSPQNQHPNSRITSPAVIIPAIGFRLQGPLPYCCLGVFPANPARRNASAIASPLAGTGLLRPARVSADRKRFSDSVGGISARAVDGRASRA
jgi:hypothetical protein